MMQIDYFHRYDYYTDGGTILLQFECTDGSRHELEIIQTTIPIRKWFARKRNGDVFLNRRKITKDSTSREAVAEAIRRFLDGDSREAGPCDVPRNTIVFGDDLQQIMSLDSVGQEQQVLKWAIERLRQQSSRPVPK